MQEDYERQLSEMEERGEKAIADVTEHFEIKLQDKIQQLDQVCMHYHEKCTYFLIYFPFCIE